MTTEDHEKIEGLGDEEIEGLGDEQPGLWGDYPIDTLLIRNESRTVHDVVRRIGQNRFVMNPDFQRDFIWNVKKQSKLIESVLMRIPLPVFYLAEDDQGQNVVVDGLQRLTTFQRFVNNEFSLDLQDRKELHKKKFRDLPAKIQNRIEDCNLILYVIDHKVPERARLDIFERVNGGVPLTRQQMRNCLYMGDATRFLREEAGNDLFRDATGNSLRWTTMRDREFVNRFCAFQILNLDEYQDMDDFLALGLEKMNADPESIPQLRSQFRTSLRNNVELFGKHAFRRPGNERGKRSQLNASLWDVMSTGLSRVSQEFVRVRSEALTAGFRDLMENDEFIQAITYGPNDPRKVKSRFEISRTMFEEAFRA